MFSRSRALTCWEGAPWPRSRPRTARIELRSSSKEICSNTKTPEPNPLTGVTPVVVQRLDERSTGAGEEVMAAAVGAIANAFFDATGKRLREYPMTPERVRAVLKG